VSAERQSKSKQNDRPKTQTVFFKSTTDRFNRIDNANPNIRIVETAHEKKRNMSSAGPGGINISGLSTRHGS
jgi:hypothetical protein